MKEKIGIFDSGIGGLTTLKEIRKILPNENYIYYADSKNNPYGKKSDEELLKITSNIVNILLKENVKVIVIACNTATTRCINMLRKKYNINFIGTEPAIKVACDNNYKNTLVMATPGTIYSERTHLLVEQNKKENQNIILLPCEGLADAIELKNKKKINEILHELLDQYKNKNIDSVVLGCTHYPHIKKEINSFFPKAKLIDGNKGVARRVKFILKENNLLNDTKIKGTVKIIQTKKE